MKSFHRYEICPSQNELLSLKLEVQLFRSLINNNIKEIKDTKIEDREEISVEDKEEKSVQDRYCKFLLLFVNCFSGKQSIPKVARKDDIIDWDFRQIYEALPHQRYGDFWPRDEMMRTLLCENLKTKVSQSDVFLHLVKIIFLSSKLFMFFSSDCAKLILKFYNNKKTLFLYF